MPRILESLIVSLVVVFATLSCAQNGPMPTDSPLSPSLLTGDSGQSTQGVQTGQQEGAGHQLWGYFVFRVDPRVPSVEMVPIRDLSLHMNILQFLEQSPCADCLKIAGIQPGPDETILIDISIKHPFANLNLTGFDVRGITMFAGSHQFPASMLVLSDHNVGDAELLNADGYTSLYNPTTSGHGIEGYIKGKLSTKTVPNATLNGYKRFISDKPANVRNAFYAGDTIVAQYQIKTPTGPFVFGYAVDASWAPPINKPVDDPMTDFGLEANCPEAWQISVTDTPILAGLTDCGGSAKLTMDVYDWQGKEDAHPVLVECPELFDGSVEGQWMDDGSGFSTYVATVENFKTAPIGSYLCLVGKEPVENDPAKPWLDLTAYQVHPLEVTAKVDLPPTAVAEAGQPSAYTGESVLFDASASHDDDCNGESIVKYEWDWNGDGNFVEEPAQISHSWTTEGDYDVQLRVTDDEGSTDLLDHPLEVLIEVYNPFNPSFIDLPLLGYRVRQLCASGDYIYVSTISSSGAGLTMLLIYDVSNPMNPLLVKRFDYPDDVYIYVELVDDIAYLISDLFIDIYDISQPTDTHLISTVNLPSPLNAFRAHNGYLYTLSYNDGSLLVIDADPPESAVIVKTIQLSMEYPWLWIQDNYLLVFDIHFNLQIVDIEVPELAHLEATWTNPEDMGIDSVAIESESVFIGDYNNDLQLFDISNPLSPVHLSTLYDGTNLGSPLVSNGYAFFTDYPSMYIMDVDPPGEAHVVSTLPYMLPQRYDPSGYLYCYGDPPNILKIVELTVPESPVIVYEVATPAEPVHENSQHEFDGNRMYLFDTLGIHIFDQNLPSAPEFRSSIHLLSKVFNLAYRDGHVLAAEHKGLGIVDVTVPEQAFIRDILPIPADWKSLILTDKYAWGLSYNLDLDGLVAFNIESVDSPQVAGQYDIFGDELAIDGNYAYVGSSPYPLYDRLEILDISDPASILPVKTVVIPHFGGDMESLVVKDGYAYRGLCDYTSLTVIDVDPPEEAFVVGNFAFGGIAGMACKGNYLYCAGKGQFFICDISDPVSPVVVKSIDSSGHYDRDVVVSGDYAFVDNCDSGPDWSIEIYDINPPEEASLLESVPTGTGNYDLWVEGEYAYMATGSGELRILKLW